MATVNRDVKYLNRDFSDIRAKLIEFSKTYFPNTYNDFLGVWVTGAGVVDVILSWMGCVTTALGALTASSKTSFSSSCIASLTACFIIFFSASVFIYCFL